MEKESWIEEAARRAGEPLNAELIPYLSGGPLGESLRHPLVYDVMFHPETAYRDNDLLAAKKTAVKSSLAAGEWETVIWLHERPYRAEALEEMVAGRVDDSIYWGLCGMVWADSENVWQEAGRWGRLLRSSRPGRECFMSEEDRVRLAGLPEELTVWRGFNGRGRARGWSWTVDEGKAEWFARRLYVAGEGEPPAVVSGRVYKGRVVGFVGGRGEEEVVVSPGRVRVVGVREC